MKLIQVTFDIAEKERWLVLYLCTNSRMVTNVLWGWLQQWKQNCQCRGKPIWAAELWQDFITWVENLVVKVHHMDAQVPEVESIKDIKNPSVLVRLPRLQWFSWIWTGSLRMNYL